MKRIAITPGEPAGIGPDLCLQLINDPFPVELIIFGDPLLLQQRAQQLNLSVNIIEWSSHQGYSNIPHTLKVFPIPLSAPCKAGHLDTRNSDYVLNCLTQATKACQQGLVDALVTGPVQKSIINEAGFNFRGHTEFLAQLTHTKKVVMMLATPKLKVALATTHLPLRDVAEAITQEDLEQTLRILHSDLKRRFTIEQPRIFVCGLNPHAGEQGHLGHEEIDIIIPVLEKLRKENFNLLGPYPADTIFIEKNLTEADAFLAMYHDQGLPVLKAQGFGQAVNITLGLPIVRTSVDHGTALHLAGTSKGNPESLKAAITMATHMVNK